MKLLKKVSIGLFIFISITSIILWILAKNTNPETIKNLVNNQLTTLTNKKTTINGSISWHLFPMPGIKITEISLGNPDKQEDFFLSINNLWLNLKITPLLRGKLVFNDVNLDGVKMVINTDVMKLPVSPKASSEQPSHESSAMQLIIDRLLISNGQIEVHSQNRNIQVKNLKLGVEQFNLHNSLSPMQLKAQFIAESAENRFKTQINYNGYISLSKNYFQNLNIFPIIEGQVQFKKTQLNTLIIDKINTNININIQAKKLRFSPLTLSLYNGESIGNMYYDFIDNKLKLNQIATNLDGKAFMKDLFNQQAMQGNLDYSIQAELPLNKASLENLSGKGSFTLKDGTIKRVNLGLFIKDLKKILPDIIKTNNKSLRAEQFDMDRYNQGETFFNLVNVQYKLLQGQLVTESFIIQTNNIQITGDGNVNLKNQTIQSHMLLTVADNNETNFLNIQQMLGGGFPIKLEGTLSKPSLSADIKLLNDALMNLSLKEIIKKPDNLENQLLAVLH